MDKDTLMQQLYRCIQTGSDRRVSDWFINLNKSYKKLRKNGKITDDSMIELVEFWYMLGQVYGEEFMEWVEEIWGGSMPAIIQDILEFSDKYSQITYERYIEKMDAFEIEEAEILAEAIWNKERRVDIHGSFFDYDDDEEKELAITIPRNDREMDKIELKKACAMVIYNRGSMILRFYQPRGRYEIAGVVCLDGTGRWETIEPGELGDWFEGGLYENEKPVALPHRKNSHQGKEEKDDSNIIYYNKSNKGSGVLS